MITTVEKPLEASQVTQVADMPPLEVVSVGIPEQEHLELPPAAPSAPPVAGERRGRLLAWALAGVMGLLLVVAGLYGLAQVTGTQDLHMGLGPQAWQEFRAGERASTTPVHMGLTVPAWQAFRAGERASEPVYTGLLRGAALPYIPNWSIPTIASIPAMSIAAVPDMSIASFPSIPAMSIASIPDVSIPSIPSIPAMSIPSIPDMSTPSTPTTPAVPSVPAMKIPSIPSISFPSFPEIPAISIPPIAAFPSIPDM